MSVLCYVVYTLVVSFVVPVTLISVFYAVLVDITVR